MSVREQILGKLFFGRDPLRDFPKDRFASDLQGWHSDHPYLARAIGAVRPAIVVEVGVWKGASVVTMAREIQRLKLDAVVIAIDTWLGSSEHYLWEKFIPDLDFEFGYPRLYHKFAANVCKEGLAEQVVPLALDSINAFQLLKERGICPDVLHIDAGHDYLSVTADLKAWWPQLRDGGVLIGDDYFKKPLVGQGKWPQVRQAFDEFFAAAPRTTFESGDGKCYVGKPSDGPHASTGSA
ncbi:MAG TPA: class I SAM-dependent methyltransferase [Rhizomicrobium sp.]|jgi:predicted O-methyltransferase YrrM|nr:class I SAM-dependent methyltransferase [Rhizomicrobium sp.]